MKENEGLRGKLKDIAMRQTVILTPNLIEFRRLWESAQASKMTNSKSAQPLPTPEEELEFFEEKEEIGYGKIDMYHPVVKPVAELARMFGNAIIVRKGITDIVTDGFSAYYVSQ